MYDLTMNNKNKIKINLLWLDILKYVFHFIQSSNLTFWARSDINKFPDYTPWLWCEFEKFPDPFQISLTFPRLLIRMEFPWLFSWLWTPCVDTADLVL